MLRTVRRVALHRIERDGTGSSANHRWSWRPGLRWFGAEFLVIVTGVLVALGLNAVYQGRRDASSERTYLALLGRDLRHTITDLEVERDFETAQLRDGIAAYRALSSPRGEENASASGALQRLTVRWTLALQNATYQDLISTGNLRLIRNRELRDRIVDTASASRPLPVTTPATCWSGRGSCRRPS